MTHATSMPQAQSELECQKPYTLRMTEDEFIQWQRGQESGKSEWVNGEAIVIMAPVSGEHDDLQGWLKSILRVYARRKDLGVVRGPQFPARLTLPDQGIARREADVLFVEKSRLHLMHKNHFEGAPNLMMEIVSPESQSRDRRDKFFEYQSAGVMEFWIIDPLSQTVEAYALEQGHYRQIDEADGRINSTAVPGWFVKPEWFWQQPLPDELAILAALGIQ